MSAFSLVTLSGATTLSQWENVVSECENSVAHRKASQGPEKTSKTHGNVWFVSNKWESLPTRGKSRISFSQPKTGGSDISQEKN